MRPSDISKLGPIHELLRELNDAVAASQKVADLVQKMPVLSARCLRAATREDAAYPVESIERALHMLGNRGLEAVLLELLEDLTMLKFEEDG